MQRAQLTTDDTKTHTTASTHSPRTAGFADAKIALDFHSGRERNPSLFSNRAVNKLWYAGYGIKAAVWDKKEVQSIDQVIALEVRAPCVVLCVRVCGTVCAHVWYCVCACVCVYHLSCMCILLCVVSVCLCLVSCVCVVCVLRCLMCLVSRQYRLQPSARRRDCSRRRR